ncbi:hypothetical protein ACLOJK_028378 [Asimina triloba]
MATCRRPPNRRSDPTTRVTMLLAMIPPAPHRIACRPSEILKKSPLPCSSLDSAKAQQIRTTSFNSDENPSSPHTAITSQQHLTTPSAIFTTTCKKLIKFPKAQQVCTNPAATNDHLLHCRCIEIHLGENPLAPLSHAATAIFFVVDVKTARCRHDLASRQSP